MCVCVCERACACAWECAWGRVSTSMNPDTIDTDVFRRRRWLLATARTSTSVSGEKITILALAGFRRDDNTA